MASTSAPHPLHQIAESTTHRLLLKQWLKEQDLISRRISLKESRIDSVRREITFLYCFFFILHSFSLLILFASSSHEHNSVGCKRAWVPSVTSLLCSLSILWALRYKGDTEASLEKLLEREKEDGLMLAKCVDELKRKGLEFDLMKEVDALRRAKSLRVETKVASGTKKWSARDFATMVMLLVSFVVLGLVRFVLCS
ncbi:hypothetical protein LUZ61_014550 [Rhynchospora tenuis]|uniref:Transmembrane protein n=1 Tax=Rhynchospora tenuis TaxID=198213 RepID=A0AAD5Z3A3_9POAL|nr:hypothetical protein LUZ61_014550 [Rhynchospora tenuis]